MPVSLQKQNEHLLQLLQDAMPAVASASLQPHGEQFRKTLQAIQEALAERYEPALSLNSVLGAVLQAGNAEAEKPLLSAEDVYKRLSPEAKARTSIEKVGDMLAKLGEPISSDQSQSDLLEEQRELPDYLNDAIDNLVHDNYELSQAGSRNRQGDADLIRAALATSPAQTAQKPAIATDWLSSYEAMGDRLLAAGWRPETDAQWDGLRRMHAEYAAPIAQTAPHMDDVTAAVRNLRCIAKTVLSSESRASMRADLESAAQLLTMLSATAQGQSHE